MGEVGKGKHKIIIYLYETLSVHKTIHEKDKATFDKVKRSLRVNIVPTSTLLDDSQVIEANKILIEMRYYFPAFYVPIRI